MRTLMRIFIAWAIPVVLFLGIHWISPGFVEPKVGIILGVVFAVMAWRNETANAKDLSRS